MSITIELVKKLRESASCGRLKDPQDIILMKEAADAIETLSAKMQDYDRLKKHDTQYLDDIDNPLEPLKISYALDSEIFILEYRKKNKPKEVNILDYTVIATLQECLKRRTDD